MCSHIRSYLLPALSSMFEGKFCWVKPAPAKRTFVNFSLIFLHVSTRNQLLRATLLLVWGREHTNFLNMLREGKPQVYEGTFRTVMYITLPHILKTTHRLQPPTKLKNIHRVHKLKNQIFTWQTPTLVRCDVNFQIEHPIWCQWILHWQIVFIPGIDIAVVGKWLDDVCEFKFKISGHTLSMIRGIMTTENGLMAFIS